MVASVSDYENSDMPERQKVALRLVDAFIVGYGDVPDDLAVAARVHFDDEELLEIGLRVFTASTNKVLIALGVDDPANIAEVRGLLSHEEYYPETLAQRSR
jgi:hypothetical protein